MTPLTRVLVLAGVVALANAQGSAGGGIDPRRAADAGKAPVNVAIAANHDFAIDLYRQLARQPADENLFFSPYSMFIALAMTAEGARGETAAEMGKALRFPQAVRHGQQRPVDTLEHGDDPRRHGRAERALQAPKPMTRQLRGRIDRLRNEPQQSQRAGAEAAR